MARQMASRWHFDPNLDQLETLLDPSWRQRAPQDVVRPPQDHAKMRQHRAETGPRHPKTSQQPPKAAKHDFNGFGKDFVMILFSFY